MNGELVWSKKTNGQGFFAKATESQQQVVYNAIQEAMGVHRGSGFSMPRGVATTSSVNANGYALLEDEANAKKKPGKCSICCSFMSAFAAIPVIIGA